MHEINVPAEPRRWYHRGLEVSLVADKGLVIENRPSAEAASFSSKDRFGGCSDKMPGRKTARGFAGEFCSIK